MSKLPQLVSFMHIFSILKPILSNLSLTVPTRVIHKNMFYYENKLAQPAL